MDLSARLSASRLRLGCAAHHIPTSGSQTLVWERPLPKLCFGPGRGEGAKRSFARAVPKQEFGNQKERLMPHFAFAPFLSPKRIWNVCSRVASPLKLC